MDLGLGIALLLVLGFAFTNGVHDASNAIAALVATRAARPAQAMLLAAVFNTLGPLLFGAAVANTIGGIVAIQGEAAIAVIAAGLLAAVAWNGLTWWLGLPSSSGHALVGGLVGAALIEGGTGAVQWGGLDGLRPVGVIGTAIALAVAPMLGALAALGVTRAVQRGLRHGTRRWAPPVRAGEWLMSAWLAFSHGSNDAQKAVGLLAAMLVADGRIASPSAPTWGILACAAALTLGTALGGWRIVKTVGRHIYRIQPIDGLSSQASSAGVIFGASILGAPVSTSHVVASSMVGVGGGRRRWRHVRWAVVGDIALAWTVTIPASALLGALTYLAYEAIT